MMIQEFSPFKYFVHDNGTDASLLLSEFNDKTHIFEERADEGWEGGGYDWGSVADVVLREQVPGLVGIVKFDPEGSMFVAYGPKESVKEFAAVLKKVYDDDALLRDALSRAELD